MSWMQLSGGPVQALLLLVSLTLCLGYFMLFLPDLHTQVETRTLLGPPFWSLLI